MQTEILGFALDARSKLSVVIACGSNRSHSYNGKNGSQVANSALKCDLKVWIARSAKFVRCEYGSANW